MVTMIEGSVLGLGYNLLKDMAGFVLRRRRRLSPDEILQRREKLKPIFEKELYRCRQENLRHDAIIYDALRLKQYPHSANSKGISAKRKVSFVDTYHGGICVSLGVLEIVFDEGVGGWRWINDLRSDPDYVNADLIGFIPYELISSVVIEGDEYSPFPIIFCHFDIKGLPYERQIYCLEQKSPHSLYFDELATADEVKLASQKAGTWPLRRSG